MSSLTCSMFDELALAAVQRRYAELVTALLDGKALSRGEVLKHAACIGAKYQTPQIAAVMQRRG